MLNVLTETVTTEAETVTKWYESVNDALDKPAMQAVIGIATVVALALTIYHFGIKKALRKRK